tara:strand:+ start:43 stop:210 length:168 start_codon:yes stop_codon:yes gene_type:complete
MNTYEAIITIKTNPVREANSEQEFIENLLEEYNDKCWELFEINKEDIQVTIGEKS